MSKQINLEEFFRDGIENFRTTIISGDAIRGYGKSYDLNKLSKIYNIPVVYSTEMMANYVARQRGNWYVCTVKNIVKHTNNRILVDEISIDEFYKLDSMGYKVIGVVR